MIQFVFTSDNVRSIESFIEEMSTMKLPHEAGLLTGTGGDNVPVCIKDYASADNVIERVDPILAERRFNAIPVRFVVDKDGRIKHIHFISAFPDQAKAITDALSQWRFRPYTRDGQPMEVETGIMFGRSERRTTP